MIGLLIFVVVVACLVWVLLQIPAFKEPPFRNILVGVAIIAIIFAVLSTLFGIDMLAEMRKLGR